MLMLHAGLESLFDDSEWSTERDITICYEYAQQFPFKKAKEEWNLEKLNTPVLVAIRTNVRKACMTT